MRMLGHALQLRCNKRAANLKKHGLDFQDARQVIEAERSVTFEDRRYCYDEQRFLTIGLVRSQLVVVVTTETETDIRIISMRKATKDEEAIFFRYAR